MGGSSNRQKRETWPCPAVDEGCKWWMTVPVRPTLEQNNMVENELVIHLLVHHPGRVQDALNLRASQTDPSQPAVVSTPEL